MVKRLTSVGSIVLLLAVAWQFVWVQSAPLPIVSGCSRAFGTLGEYERGEIDLDALLADYQAYGLPLPVMRSRLVGFNRGIWLADGPTEVSHLGFQVNDPDASGAGRQLLVGPIVFRTDGSDISRMVPDDRVVDDLKPRVVTGKLELWNESSLSGIEIIFHGQDSSDADLNALLCTGIQLHHLGDPRALRFVEESLRMDVDEDCCNVSDFIQPAGWAAHEILAEVAWRLWLTCWNRGEVGDEQVRKQLTRILPHLPMALQAAARELLDSIDPDLAAGVSCASLGSAVAHFAAHGGDWEALVERVKREPNSFSELMALLDDKRVLQIVGESGMALPGDERYRQGYQWRMRPDGWISVSDYAAWLLDARSEYKLIGCAIPFPADRLSAFKQRAQLWEQARLAADPIAFIKQRWVGSDAEAKRRLNLAAIELHGMLDFDGLMRDLPDRFVPDDAGKVEELERTIEMACHWELARLKRQQILVNQSLFRQRSVELFRKLHDRVAERHHATRAILIQQVWNGTPRRKGPKMDELAATVLQQVETAGKLPDGPFAASAQAWVGRSIPDWSPGLFWRLFVDTSHKSHPGLVVEQMSCVVSGRKWLKSTELRYLIELLKDDRRRVMSEAPERYEGAAFTEYENLRVGDFAALYLARYLDLPWVPEPQWDDAEWERFRSRVHAAVERLKQRDGGQLVGW